MKGSHKKGLLILTGLVVVLILAMPYIQIEITKGYISGYGGIETKLVNVYTPDGLASGSEKVGPTTWKYDADFGFLDDRTGITWMVGESNEGSPIKYLDDIEQSIDNQDGTYTKRTWSSQVIPVTLGVTARTSGVGLAQEKNMVATLQVSKNDFSFFVDADFFESFVFRVATVNSIIDDSSLIEGSPSAGGVPLDLTRVGSFITPAWLIGAGYSANLDYTDAVTFELTVDFAQPQSFGIIRLGEVEVTWSLQIDMLCIGYWEYTGPNLDYDPKGDDNWFAWLGDLFLPLLALGSTVIVAIAVVVIGLVIIIYGRKR